MELSDLDGKRVILKSLVRSKAGNYIGTKEEVGRVVGVGEIIRIVVDEGAAKGELKNVPLDEIYVSEAELSSYVLGGTGPWERSADFVKVDDADYIIEWECVRSENIAYERLQGQRASSYEKTSVIAALKKDADVFGIAEASRYIEEAEDELKKEKAAEARAIAGLDSAFKVMRFDSVKQYSGLTPATRDSYGSEEEANGAMTETAKKFVKDVKKSGYLIDIKRLSDNSVKIEYVDRTGGEAYVIFQVSEERESKGYALSNDKH